MLKGVIEIFILTPALWKRGVLKRSPSKVEKWLEKSMCLRGTRAEFSDCRATKSIVRLFKGQYNFNRSQSLIKSQSGRKIFGTRES